MCGFFSAFSSFTDDKATNTGNKEAINTVLKQAPANLIIFFATFQGFIITLLSVFDVPIITQYYAFVKGEVSQKRDS